jgi:hypothetical protein
MSNVPMSSNQMLQTFLKFANEFAIYIWNSTYSSNALLLFAYYLSLGALLLYACSKQDY